MDWIETLGDINYVGVLVAVLASFAIGATWYAEALFGKTWMKIEGLKKKDVENKEKMKKAMIHTTFAQIIKAIILACLIYVTAVDGWIEGLVFGAVVALGFSVGSLAMHNSYSQKPTMLTRIHGAHDIVSVAVMGAIIAGIGF